jgi:hypothetical protein
MSGVTLVFLGSSLPPTVARRILPDAIYLPPASQGDVYRAVQAHRPDRVALIDGAFLSMPAVWHRELLWGLAEGIAIYGASSMGALRAAELARFGMVGVGKVFEAYRDGIYPPFDDAFEDDDEVAVVHAPNELGGMPISDAMVDLRETLAGAEAAGIIDAGLRDRLARVLKECHFPDRSLARLAEAAHQLVKGEAGAVIAKWIDGHARSQKALDARTLLERLAHPEERVACEPFRFERALVWERFRQTAEVVPESDEDGLVLRELARDMDAWRNVERQATGRLFTLAPGEALPDAEIRAALDEFRRRRGLLTRASLDGWLADNAVSERGLIDLISRDRLSAERVGEADRAEIRRAMLDELRLAGRFAGLLSSARGRLSSQPADPPAGLPRSDAKEGPSP